MLACLHAYAHVMLWTYVYVYTQAQSIFTSTSGTELNSVGLQNGSSQSLVVDAHWGWQGGSTWHQSQWQLQPLPMTSRARSSFDCILLPAEFHKGNTRAKEKELDSQGHPQDVSKKAGRWGVSCLLWGCTPFAPLPRVPWGKPCYFKWIKIWI